MFFKGEAEVAEVVPSGVGGDETGGDVDAGVVVHSEKKNLLLRRGPPLVDGAVVLPKLADVSPAKAAVSANAGRRSWEQMREVFFEVSLHAGTSADEAVEALEFIGDELKIGRGGERDELGKKGEDIRGPDTAMRAAAGYGAEGIPPLEPSGTQFVEPSFSDAELRGSRGSVESGGIKIGEDAADKLGWKAVDKLLLFIPPRCPTARPTGSTSASARDARLSVGLRYAPASSEAGVPR